MSDQEAVTLVILRTNDAKKTEIDMQMSASLNDLKDKINSSVAFSPLSRGNQRLFHMGRELKNNRSLSALGVGRFKCFTIHLLAKGGIASKSNDGSSNNNNEEEVVEVVAKRKAKSRRSTRSAGAVAAQAQQQPDPGQVIELDDSDDDDVVEVAAPPKRRKNRR